MLAHKEHGVVVGEYIARLDENGQQRRAYICHGIRFYFIYKQNVLT